MNKARRTIIKRAIGDVEQILQDVLDEERDSFENMPESLQESPNGQASIEAQENLEAAIDALEDAISYLEDIE